MSEYTPGPWRAIVSEGYNVQGEEGAIHSVHAPNGGYIATVEGGDDEAAANAHLIAAAPDLLEAQLRSQQALEFWKDWYTRMGKEIGKLQSYWNSDHQDEVSVSYIDTTAHRDALRLSRTAIKKARGKA